MSKIVAIESPLQVIEGAKMNYSATYLGVSAVTGTPTVAVYRNKTVITDAAIPSGSASASGNIITLPEIVFGSNDGGTDYVIVITCIADGNTDVRKFIVNVVKAKIT
ncbi:MAG: hypothetical protein JRD69_09900 [Deltaproteobacteria bacterium]|nr:hypothetical protein [Deltaproteobacteria bacterium]